MYLLITGCTGVGKSTLAVELEKKLKIKCINDPFIDNPYINTAYSNNPIYYFHSQLHFAVEFYKIHKNKIRSTSSILQERSIFECYEIFAKMLYKKGILSENDFKLFENIYHIMLGDEILFPNKIIFLDATSKTILSRIKKRNRVFESSIDASFIDLQRTMYHNWLESIPSSTSIIRINNESKTIPELIPELMQNLCDLN